MQKKKERKKEAKTGFKMRILRGIWLERNLPIAGKRRFKPV